MPVITIDGPSGTGKGTLCHLLANHLGWHILDSGLLYRILAYAAAEAAIPLTETEKLVALTSQLDVNFKAESDGQVQVILGNKDVFAAIRTEACGDQASILGVNPQIRQALLARQRAFATLPGLVTDGRDMGTVVFPDAFLKIFLYADPKERAKRRYLQLQEKENHVSLRRVFDDLMRRDERDKARLHAPLKPAPDAVLIDTTELTTIQVFQHVLGLLQVK